MKRVYWVIGLFVAVRLAMHAAGWPESTGAHQPETPPTLHALFGGTQTRSVDILTEDSVVVRIRIPPGPTLAIQSELGADAAPMVGREITEFAGDITLTVHTCTDSLTPAPEDVRLYMEVRKAIVKVIPSSRLEEPALGVDAQY